MAELELPQGYQLVGVPTIHRSEGTYGEEIRYFTAELRTPDGKVLNVVGNNAEEARKNAILKAQSLATSNALPDRQKLYEILATVRKNHDKFYGDQLITMLEILARACYPTEDDRAKQTEPDEMCSSVCHDVLVDYVLVFMRLYDRFHVNYEAVLNEARKIHGNTK